MLSAPSHRQGHDRTGSEADDPFGMAAPQCIDENIAPIGGHEDEVGGDPVRLRHDLGGHPALADLGRPTNTLGLGQGDLGQVFRVTDVQQSDVDVDAGQARYPCSKLHRRLRSWGVGYWDEYSLQREPAGCSRYEAAARLGD